MRAKWPHDQCIICLNKARLTLEHVIPDSIGGILTCKFICRDCNSRLGHSVEASLKSDPSIRIAISQLQKQLPELHAAIEEGQAYSIDVGPAKLRGTMREGQVKGAEARLEDGSVIKAEENTEQALVAMLMRDGHDRETIDAALDAWRSAGSEELVQISERFSIKKWNNRPAQPTINGGSLNPVALLKIAYEFAALLVGGAILHKDRQLERIRSAIRNNEHSFAHDAIEFLQAPNYGTYHGIYFDGTGTVTVIEIRLFGKLAYRVSLPGIALQLPNVVYTHDLRSGRDYCSKTDR